LAATLDGREMKDTEMGRRESMRRGKRKRER
jgi:hypothetical protein